MKPSAGFLAAPLLAPLPAAARDMALGPVVRTALPGCDDPTPVKAPSGAVYSNVSDCSPAGIRLSTGWVQLRPAERFVQSGVTTTGDGARGLKLSGALVEGGTLYLLERNVRGGGTRLGVSVGVERPEPRWSADIGFGWASFAQASPDGYEYVYLRDSRTAYGPADRVDLARVPKGKVGDLAAWQVFAGSSAASAWVPWASRAARRPMLSDLGRIDRPHVSHLGGCWTMAVTMPPASGTRGGSGLAVYTSAHPAGPWNRRYYVTGENLGESAQFSPLYPGKLLLTAGDRFEWRRYSLSGGC